MKDQQISIEQLTEHIKILEKRLKESEERNHILLEESGRKQVELALREERDKAQRYLDTVEAIIVALDTNGRITLLNRKGCEVLGYDEKELLGKNWFESFLPPKQRKRVKQVFREIIKGNIDQVEYYENPITTRNGEERIIAWHNKILRDANDIIIGTLGAGDDITIRKQAEKKTLELLQQNRGLTQRLFQIQEQERRHIARELHDDNSQWLTALRMHAHILAGHCGGAKPEIRDSIREIEDISSQMQKNIRRMIRKLRAVDLNEMGLKDSLNELVNSWQTLYPKTHCDLDMAGEFEDLNNTLGVTIYRIIQEGLTNVSKHAEANSVKIQLRRITDQSDDSDVISLQIRDDGKGMEYSSQINGFGLAGMRERVLAARGEFEFTSSPSEGVTIKIQLPSDIKDRRKNNR